MPTRPRIDIAGYHHIINRGVNRCEVFSSSSDKEMFLKILNKTAMVHKVIVHNYCLMDNHYHLLIETQSKPLIEHFSSAINREERNNAVVTAYEDGYTQRSIADHLGVSTSLISKIIKAKV